MLRNPRTPFASTAVFIAVYSFAAIISAQPRRHMFVTTKLEVERQDSRFVQLTAGTFRNEHEETALNMTYTTKIDVPLKTKFGIKSFLVTGSGRRMIMFQYEKAVKEALEMESFDARALLDKYANPPLSWPLKKGVLSVTYYLSGWVPDESQYATYLYPAPDGQYIVQFYMILPNRTKMYTLNWWVLKDYKHMLDQ